MLVVTPESKKVLIRAHPSAWPAPHCANPNSSEHGGSHQEPPGATRSHHGGRTAATGELLALSSVVHSAQCAMRNAKCCELELELD